MANSGRPNLIWIFGDQHRAQALRHAGDPNAHTPVLDRLAQQGVSFTNAVAGCPWCTPFRGALLTSQYIHRTVQRTPSLLDASIPLVSDAFNEHGYRTAYYGKWHLSGNNKPHFIPRENRGRFDTFIGFENNNKPFDTPIHGHDEHGRDDTEADAERITDFQTDGLTDRFIAHLRERAQGDEPFFSVLSVEPPHDPYVAPPEYADKYDPAALSLRPNVPDWPEIEEKARTDLAGYYAMIENLDHNVGRILDALEELGLADNTHLAFFSDHGDMHGSHGYSHKSSPWEESVRIPCIWRPAREHARQGTSDAPMNHVDFAPTSLRLCGLPIPDHYQGTSFAHHLVDNLPAPETEPRSAFLQHAFRKRFSCLNRVWRGVRTIDGWKYVCLEHQPVMLFDLNNDPYEMTNLAYLDKYNDKREELQSELAAWLERTGDTFPLPEL